MPKQNMFILMMIVVLLVIVSFNCNNDADNDAELFAKPIWFSSRDSLYVSKSPDFFIRVHVEEGILNAAEAQDLSQVFVVNGQRQVLVYDLKSCSLIRTILVPELKAKYGEECDYMEKLLGVSQDGSRIAFINGEGNDEILIYDTNTGKSKVIRLAYSPLSPRFGLSDGKLYLACPNGSGSGSNDSVAVFDVETGKNRYYPIGGDFNPGVGFLIAPDKCLVTASNGLYILDLNSGIYKQFSEQLYNDLLYSSHTHVETGIDIKLSHDKKFAHILAKEQQIGAVEYNLLVVSLENGKAYRNVVGGDAISFAVSPDNIIYLAFADSKYIERVALNSSGKGIRFSVFEPQEKFLDCHPDR